MLVRHLLALSVVTATASSAYGQSHVHHYRTVAGILLCNCGGLGGTHGNLPVVGLPPKSRQGGGELLFNANATGVRTQPMGMTPVTPGSNAPPPLFPSSSVAAPLYSSRPQAAAKLYLDFDGIDFQGTWGNTGRSPGVVPRYNTDGDASSFSPGELTAIYEIYSRVAEAYSPFNVDVTTVDPGTPSARRSVRVVIGGSNGWFGGGGGVAYIGSFTYADYSYGTAWVFPENLGGGNAKFVADAAIHEAGHTFGLFHQQQINANGVVVSEYRTSENDAVSAPNMGVAYYRDRGVWSNGNIGYGNSQFIRQDDFAQLASTSAAPYNHPVLGTSSFNGFGVRADDFANTFAAATAIPPAVDGGLFGAPTPRVLSISGVIERITDVDMFSFSLGGGDVSIDIDNALFGAMLDTRLMLYSSTGTLLETVNPPISAGVAGLGLDVRWTGFLDGGTYYVGVAGAGNYGDLGQYTLSVFLPFSSVPEPGFVLSLLIMLPLASRRR